MSKEIAIKRPSVGQMLRSSLPYLYFLNKNHKGRIEIKKTANNDSFFVYLPPDYEVAKEGFPVLYHLHGAGMFWNWVKHDIYWIATQHEKAVERGVVKPMIIVVPFDATKFNMWSDNKKGDTTKATMVVEDIRTYIETHFKAKKERNSRFIQGFSMGGFGAAMLGLKYQDLFATITILDGAMHSWETLCEMHPKLATSVFGDDEHYFNEWSPWEWAKKADLSQIPILIIEGLMADYNMRYFEHLKKQGGRVKYVSSGCLHNVHCLQNHSGIRAFEFMDTYGALELI